MAGKNGKIRQYRKPLNINLGIIIFSVIFIYIVICVFLYFTQKQIQPYEVRTGSLSVDSVYRGIALREETVVTSTDSGYINYYAREGERVGSGKLVCSVDESGELKEMFEGRRGGGRAAVCGGAGRCPERGDRIYERLQPEAVCGGL